jgi:hypothetical protein
MTTRVSGRGYANVWMSDFTFLIADLRHRLDSSCSVFQLHNTIEIDLDGRDEFFSAVFETAPGDIIAVDSANLALLDGSWGVNLLDTWNK